MLKRRLIPVPYLMDGLMARSETFFVHNIIGHPVSHVERLVQWDLDELILLDISRQAAGYEIVRIAETCAVPLTFGGHLRTLADVRIRILNGADKVAINTAAVRTPELVEEVAREFGSQVVAYPRAKNYLRQHRNDIR